MHREFMARAVALALENVTSGRGGPFAAVIVRDGKLLAEGVNLVTSSKDPTAHAEVVAIREACRQLDHFQLTGCEIYSTCEPCPMCMGAIYWARPAGIYFACTRQDAAAIGFDDSLIYEQLDVPITRRKIPTRQIMREEALACFNAWREKPDRISY